MCGTPPPVASWLLRLRSSAKRRIASTRSSFVDELERVHARVGERGAKLRLVRLGRRLEAPAKPAVVRVDEDLLTRLGVLHDEHAEVGQLHFERVVEAHGDDVVPLREMRRAAPPIRGR